MARHTKTFYLFNPIRLTKREVSYKEAMEYTGLKSGPLGSMKTRKKFIASSGVYFLDKDVTANELKEFVAKAVIEDEIWKRIEGFEDYQISTYGRIKSNVKSKEVFLLPIIDRSRRLCIGLKKNGKVHKFLVHRLVAEAFLEKPTHKDYQRRVLTELDYVGHKNADVFDNRASNLIWLSKSDLHRVKNKKTVEVIRVDPVTKEEEIYDSIKEAAEDNFVTPAAIANCARGIYATSAGYIWIRRDKKKENALV